MVIGLWLGWVLTLAGAVVRSVRIWRPEPRLAILAVVLHGLALLLIALTLFLASVAGPALWVQPATSAMLAVAGASLALLLALVLHPSGNQTRDRIFELVLAWLIVAIGVWGGVLGASVISTAAAV